MGEWQGNVGPVPWNLGRRPWDEGRGMWDVGSHPKILTETIRLLWHIHSEFIKPTPV